MMVGNSLLLSTCQNSKTSKEYVDRKKTVSKSGPPKNSYAKYCSVKVRHAYIQYMHILHFNFCKIFGLRNICIIFAYKNYKRKGKLQLVQCVYLQVRYISSFIIKEFHVCYLCTLLLCMCSTLYDISVYVKTIILFSNDNIEHFNKMNVH